MSEKLSIELCPFCGSKSEPGETDIPKLEHLKDRAPTIIGYYISVSCENTKCEASGPLKMTFEEAIKGWNKRSG